MSILRISNLSFKYEDRRVFRNIFFSMDTGEKIGLIGRNGSGKTSIFKLILGQEQPDEGAIDLNKEIKISYFSQFSELNGQKSIHDILEDVFEPIRRIERELDDVAKLLNASADQDDTNRLIGRQQILLAEMDRLDGWNYRVQIDTVLTKMGFDARYRSRPLYLLSSGWKNRAALCKIIMEDSDLILLDEPTNYLDIEGLAWLEKWINASKKAFIVVSHDRHFVDCVAKRIIEIENYHLQEYKGDYTYYTREKKLRLKTLENQFEHEEELLIYEMEAIKDRKEQGGSKRFKRKLADIDKKMEPKPVDKIFTGIYNLLDMKERLLYVEGIEKRFDDKLIFSDVSFSLSKGNKICIIGPNGCGKSTLLHIVSTSLEPDRGEVKWCKGVSFTSFNQVYGQLDPNTIVTKYINNKGLAFSAPKKTINKFLTMMQFTEKDLMSKISYLSGGQRARLALACCLLSGAQVILLDEPTNHLDITSAQVLERAIVNFPGAVLLVSHDRFFIDKVATSLLVFKEDGKVNVINGTYTQAASRSALIT